MDGTYAPQSPDLSSFLSSPPKTQQPYNPQLQSSNQSTSYAPRSPVIPSFNSASSAHHNLHSYTNAFGGSAINHNNNSNNNHNNNSEFAEYGQSSTYMPPIPALPPSHSFPAAPQAPSSSSYYAPQRPSRKAKNEAFSYSELDADAEDDYSPLSPYNPHPDMSSSARGPRIKGDPSTSTSSSFPPAQPQSQPQYKNPNPNNIEIKTKFPVARIKRIMQADEEVGKVAQVTPVAVSKALELFMIALVSGAAAKAREKGSKKVSAAHLKMVVEGDEQWDFLGEIVGRVGDVQEGAGGEARKRKGKGESESEEEEKKAKKGRGRKKKADD